MTADPEITQETFEETEQETAIEPPYRVFIHNDEVTPYDFVIVILQKIFDLTPLESEHVTFIAHTSGVAYDFIKSVTKIYNPYHYCPTYF